MARAMKIRSTTTDARIGTRKVVFTYDLAPQAKRVYLAADFNHWDAHADPMIKKDGIFSITYDLWPGEYQYKFVVDGQWCMDPAATLQAPNGWGGMNSVVRV